VIDILVSCIGLTPQYFPMFKNGNGNFLVQSNFVMNRPPTRRYHDHYYVCELLGGLIIKILSKFISSVDKKDIRN
jgi:hypothetical protein